MAKNFIRIQSKKNITVAAGLQSINMSNKNAHVPDRYNVASAWVGTRVLIREGIGYYPIEIKDWDAVKALVKDGILTLGVEVDEIPENEMGVVTKAEETISTKKRVKAEIEKYKKQKEATDADPLTTESKAQTLKF